MWLGACHCYRYFQERMSLFFQWLGDLIDLPRRLRCHVETSVCPSSQIVQGFSLDCHWVVGVVWWSPWSYRGAIQSHSVKLIELKEQRSIYLWSGTKYKYLKTDSTCERSTTKTEDSRLYLITSIIRYQQKFLPCYIYLLSTKCQ